MATTRSDLKRVNRTLRQRLPIRALARQINTNAKRKDLPGLGGFSQSPMAVAVRARLEVKRTGPLVSPYVSLATFQPGEVMKAYNALVKGDDRRIRGGREYR